MKNTVRSIVLKIVSVVYLRIIRRVIFLMSAHKAHEHTIRLLYHIDASDLSQFVMRSIHHNLEIRQESCVGGVKLPHPFILAAGFVKGIGFDTEEHALAAVRTGKNIIPGWRTMPSLVGAIEFGSFTRWPRLGNSGTVIWRDAKSQSTQNRVGLRNPGTVAASEFLCQRQKLLPHVYGINIAVSPGVIDEEQEQYEVLESIGMFLAKGIYPAWFTLNLSCPNTQDDPTASQTEAKARHLCDAIVKHIRDKAPHEIPLWVKVGPNLADEQYQVLMCAFAETGVSAVIATNTLPAPAPDVPQLTAGIGGGELHLSALEAVSCLMKAKLDGGYKVDVIGCGGVMNGETYRNFRRQGVSVVQYYGALIYRGPLAAAIIMNEV